MTRSFSPGGVPTQAVAEYYRKRAAAAVVIVSEGTVVERPASLQRPRCAPRPRRAGWLAKRDDTVHGAGGAMASQLWHVGAVRNRRTTWLPPGPWDSPSGYSSPGKKYL